MKLTGIKPSNNYLDATLGPQAGDYIGQSTHNYMMAHHMSNVDLNLIQGDSGLHLQDAMLIGALKRHMADPTAATYDYTPAPQQQSQSLYQTFMDFLRGNK